MIRAAEKRRRRPVASPRRHLPRLESSAEWVLSRCHQRGTGTGARERKGSCCAGRELVPRHPRRAGHVRTWSRLGRPGRGECPAGTRDGRRDRRTANTAGSAPSPGSGRRARPGSQAGSGWSLTSRSESVTTPSATSRLAATRASAMNSEATSVTLVVRCGPPQRARGARRSLQRTAGAPTRERDRELLPYVHVRGAGVEGRRSGELVVAEHRERLLQRDARFQTGQRRAQAAVNALTESKMPGAAAVDVEPVGVWELPLVAVRGAG